MGKNSGKGPLQCLQLFHHTYLSNPCLLLPQLHPGPVTVKIQFLVPQQTPLSSLPKPKSGVQTLGLAQLFFGCSNQSYQFLQVIHFCNQLVQLFFGCSNQSYQFLTRPTPCLGSPDSYNNSHKSRVSFLKQLYINEIPSVNVLPNLCMNKILQLRGLFLFSLAFSTYQLDDLPKQCLSPGDALCAPTGPQYRSA